MVLVNYKVSLKEHPILFFGAKFHILVTNKKKLVQLIQRLFLGKKWPKVA
jgi:hypothetical protein